MTFLLYIKCLRNLFHTFIMFTIFIGIIGDWKNYFTEEQNIEFTKLYNEKMKDSNLELLFDPEEIDNRNNNGEMINKTMNSEKSRQILNGNINNMKERET